MNVICLQDEAFYALIDEVVARIMEKQKVTREKWISPERAMEMLNISSKTTLQTYRDEGKIRFSQPAKKIILYDIDSIEEFINKNVREKF